jgi:multidrug efflux pump subunit AcrA (membrane-fusion protein)
MAAPIEIDIASNGYLVGVGSVLDPNSRSLAVIFALRDPPANLVLNQAVQANIRTGQSRQALSVPASALIDDGGQRVVYVMRSGESFSRVPVKVGIRDGERFEIVDGLQAGERVVARGAMQIRLAAATPEAMGHGHAH